MESALERNAQPGPYWWKLPGLIILTALAPAIWGTTYVVTTELLPPDRPLLAGAIRALPAGLIVLAVTRVLPRRDWWWRAAVLGMLNIGAFFALLFVAAYRLPGGIAATLNALQPLIVAGLAFALLAERPGWWRIGWGVAGVVGVGMMVLSGTLYLDPLGLIAGAAGAGAMAGGIVLTRRWGRPVGLLPFTGWQLTAGGLFLLPLALFFEGPLPAMDRVELTGYAWLALPGGLLAYLLWFHGVHRLSVTSVAFLGLLSPVVATVLGWLVLGQSLSPAQTLGFGLALAAIVAAQISPARSFNLFKKRPEQGRSTQRRPT